MTYNAHVSIIIPVFNKWELTKNCLESLAVHTPDCVEVLVVDNHSSDDTCSECRPFGERLFGSRFRLLRQDENRNFGPACNIGARSATGTYLLFLNNDTVVTEGWLPPLLACFERDPALGAVGPLLLYPAVGTLRDRVQHLGIVFEPQFYPHHLYEFFPASHPVTRKRRRFQALTAAALMLPRDLFMASGLFDEAFINGGEDVELGLRICRGGHTLTCEPDSVVYHLASQTPGRHMHERHNAAILKERALGSICPDLHLLVAFDGYETRLTPWLKWHADIAQRRKEMYERQVQTVKSSQALRHALSTMLDREPMWIEGYRLLARLEEAAGDTDTAIALLFIVSRLYHHPDSFIPLLRLAVKANDKAMADYAEVNIRWFSDNCSYEYFKAIALEMSSFYAKVQAPQLEALYADWLAREEFLKGMFDRYRRNCDAARAERHHASARLMVRR